MYLAGTRMQIKKAAYFQAAFLLFLNIQIEKYRVDPI
jgi:hypothetical protein